MRFLAAAIVTAFIALPASAQVYQCKDASGKLTFSDRPCSNAHSGGIVQRKKSDDEIYRERAEAAEANERKYQRQINEMQQRQIESQQRVIDQQARQAGAPPPEQLGASRQCKEARKELEFVSSIRTVSQDEKRMRTNAAITNVNAACGSNTQLMQEPKKAPARASQIVHCDIGFCTDNLGNAYSRSGPYLHGPNGQVCQQSGTMWHCN
jgi:hypothetical protein